jgi:hypothetical protein
MFLNRLLKTPPVGLPRAERVISDHYEVSNEKKQVSRLGAEEQLTTRTEKAYALNSIATSCIFSGSELPIKEAMSVPWSLNGHQEFMGMQYKLLAWFKEHSSNDDGKENTSEDPEAEVDLANFFERHRLRQNTIVRRE